MDKRDRILKFVLNSIENYPNDFELGEIIRLLFDALWELPYQPYCPFTDHLRLLIMMYSNDGMLGEETRKMYQILKNELYAE